MSDYSYPHGFDPVRPTLEETGEDLLASSRLDHLLAYTAQLRGTIVGIEQHAVDRAWRVTIGRADQPDTMWFEGRTIDEAQRQAISSLLRGDYHRLAEPSLEQAAALMHRASKASFQVDGWWIEPMRHWLQGFRHIPSTGVDWGDVPLATEPVGRHTVPLDVQVVKGDQTNIEIDLVDDAQVVNYKAWFDFTLDDAGTPRTIKWHTSDRPTITYQPEPGDDDLYLAGLHIPRLLDGGINRWRVLGDGNTLPEPIDPALGYTEGWKIRLHRKGKFVQARGRTKRECWLNTLEHALENP